MKYLALAILLISASANAGKPMGIGRMQIGVTSIDSIPSIIGDTIEETSTFLEGVNEALYSNVVELVKPTGSWRSQYPSYYYVPGYRFIHIGYWKYQDLTFMSVELIFHNDTLIHFRSKPVSGIAEVLEYKYGAPKVTTTKKTINCVYKLTGIPTEYEEIKTDKSWISDGKVATEYSHKEYSDKCQPETISFFTMSDPVKYFVFFGSWKMSEDKPKDIDKLNKY